MHLNHRRILVAGSVSGALLLLAACASNSGSNPSAATPLTVTVTGSTTVPLGSTSQYAAKVTGSSNQAVTWNVNQAAGGTAQSGTISATGLYTAPAAIPSSGTIVIAAVSAADSTISGVISVALQAPVGAATSVTVTGPAAVNIGTPAQYSAAVAGTQNQSVTWAINGSGTISATGLYTPPSSVPSNSAIVITATSVATPAISGNLDATILPQSPPVSASAAARFLDQTSFGPTAAGITQVQQIGLEAALAEQFNQSTTKYSQPPLSDSECSNNFHCTMSDFLKVSAWGNDQLRQRVANGSTGFLGRADSRARRHAVLSQYPGQRCLYQLSHHHAGRYALPPDGRLSQHVEQRSAAPGQIANENFGREMMQLFSLGPELLNADGTLQTDSGGNPTPAYTELQVEAFARAYTGWTFANSDGSAPPGLIWTYNYNHPMVPVEKAHDTTQKILLDGTMLPAGQTAEQDLKGALDNIFAHANIGPFICKQLIQHLVTGNPSPGYVERVSAVFADNGGGVRGDMKAVLTAIIMDQEARAGDTQTGDQADAESRYRWRSLARASPLDVEPGARAGRNTNQ